MSESLDVLMDYKLFPVSVYLVDDGGGHTDEMTQSDPGGSFYLRFDVDLLIKGMRDEIERLRRIEGEVVSMVNEVEKKDAEIERLRGVVTTLAQYVADKGAGRVGKYNECCRALESAYGLNWRAALAATTEGQGVVRDRWFEHYSNPANIGKPL